MWKNIKQWSPRPRTDNIVATHPVARMVTNHPNKGEKFYLCLLLKHGSGATAFTSLRTVNREIKPTYKAACISFGFFQNDNQLVECLQEAVRIAYPNSIRGLFCNFTINSNPNEPEVLFNLCSEPITEDFLRRCQQDLGLKEVAYNDLLLDLNSIFEDNFTQMLSVGFRCQIQIFISKNFKIVWSLIQMQDFFRESYGKMNPEQRFLFQKLRRHIDSREGAVTTLMLKEVQDRLFLPISFYHM